MTMTFEGITIDGGPTTGVWNGDRYERVVRLNLQQLFSTSTGRAVKAQLRKDLTIVPFTGAVTNAYAGPVDWPDATPDGRPILSCGGATVGNATGGTGTGRGSDVLIKFTPADWRVPHAILLHEMVHGVRIMAGLLSCASEGNNFDTVEEFFAIAVTNVYRGELGHSFVRRDHHGFNPTSGAGFGGSAITVRVLQLMRQMPTFSSALARVRSRTGVNPFLDAI